MESMSPADILIVEDSPTQAEELHYILEKNGYCVVAAHNGREALDMLHTKKPVLVISDIVMPEMDGFELCRQIKGNDGLKEIPVILLTALGDPEDVLRGLECGADNFIIKPYDESYLIARVHQMLINTELRKVSKVQMGVEIFFKEQKYFITSQRQQILDLLLSTYETAVIKNHELKAVQEKLEALNEQLEMKVEERTAALLAEIEERKKAEEEIKRLNDGLEQRVAMRTQELEAANRELEAFAYSISHDLRAPLRAIDGFARILSEDHASGLDAEGDRVVAVIGKNARRMGQLIDDILAFSRIGRQEMRCTIVPMHDIAQEVYEELKEAEGERTIRFTLASLPPAQGDPALIRQVLHNLLANSIKYTRPREIAEVEVGCRCRDGEHVYFVRDNGVGFNMKYAGKMFGVFQRLQGAEEFEGTGVGLAIVQRIVVRHGGRIWGEGETGKGACFYFTFPSNSQANALQLSLQAG